LVGAEHVRAASAVVKVSVVDQELVILFEHLLLLCHLYSVLALKPVMTLLAEEVELTLVHELVVLFRYLQSYKLPDADVRRLADELAIDAEVF